MGSYKNPSILDEENLMKIHELLKNLNIKVKAADFEEFERKIEKSDFVYFDPPYDPLSNTANFTSYTKESFGEQEQVRLASLFTRLSSKGCLVLLSNSDTELIRELYSDFHIHESIMVPRFINSDSSKRKPIGELAITNYPAKKVQTVFCMDNARI